MTGSRSSSRAVRRSPDPDPEVVEDLNRVGIHVRRMYEPNLADLYRAAHSTCSPAVARMRGRSNYR